MRGVCVMKLRAGTKGAESFESKIFEIAENQRADGAAAVKIPPKCWNCRKIIEADERKVNMWNEETGF